MQPMSERARHSRSTKRQPGALLHIDAYSAPKFLEPGHRVTGDRDKNGRPGGLGKTVVIAVQDDHSRIVYAELHWAENAANVSVTLGRGAAWMREHGCGPLEAVISDNAKCCTGRLFAGSRGGPLSWLDPLSRRHRTAGIEEAGLSVS